jgi:hypothetical protein
MNFMGNQTSNVFGQTSTFGPSQPSNLLIPGNTNTNMFNPQPTNAFSTFGSAPNPTQNQQSSMFNTGANSNQNGGLFGNTNTQQSSIFSPQTQSNPTMGWANTVNTINPNGGMTGLGQSFVNQQNQMTTQSMVQPKVLESSQEFENTLKNYISIFK